MIHNKQYMILSDKVEQDDSFNLKATLTRNKGKHGNKE